MSVWVPKIKLYASNGTTLLYTFPAVQDHNAPGNDKNSIAISNFRAAGGIIIPGGNKMWELTISFIILAEGYENLAPAINSLETTIEFHTPYLIKVDMTDNSYFNQSAGGYKVKRTKPFEYPDRSKDLMNDMQKVTARFDVNAW